MTLYFLSLILLLAYHTTTSHAKTNNNNTTVTPIATPPPSPNITSTQPPTSPPTTTSSSESQFTFLANGFIITRTPVQPQASISLDIRDMLNSLLSGDFPTATSIYTNGIHSWKLDANGNNTTKKRTLQSFSQRAQTDKFYREPTFVFHIYGLSGGTSKRSHYRYADEFVLEALQDVESGTLALEAVCALNVWMYVAHELWDGVYDCRREEIGLSLNTPNEGLEENDGGVHAIDEAMAYWIGEGQELVTGNKGYSLFEVSQGIGGYFGTGGGGGGNEENTVVSNANMQLKTLYEEAQNLLAASGRCSPNSGTWQRLYHITHQMTSVMTIPLIQLLIESVAEVDHPRIKLYALAIIPQIAACKPSTHRYLMEKLYTNVETYTENDRNDVLQHLQSTYSCLGITCEDIGAYKTFVVPQCADPPPDLPLAGYQPTFPHPEHAKLDLDILQIKILARMEDYTSAQMIYELGKNSAISAKRQQYRTLQSMATSKGRKVVRPFYDVFVSFHSNDDYAHDTIEDALEGSGRYGLMTTVQRTDVIVKTIQYQVLYMYVLEEFYRSLAECRVYDNQIDDMIGYWDKGVAYVIGSIEGHSIGGAESGDGMSLFNLANERCAQFDTCTPQGYALILEGYIELFESGINMLETDDCDSVETMIRKLAHLLMLPVIQSVIRNAIKNEKVESFDAKDRSLVEGEVYALSILPLVYGYDPEAAKVIQKNMVIKSGVKPVVDGAQVVADAFSMVMEEFGIPCEAVGQSEGVSVCRMDGRMRSLGVVERGNAWFWGGLIGLLVVIAIV